MLAGFTRAPAPAAAWAQIYDGCAGTNSLVTRVLSPDGTDRYTVTKAGCQVRMTAPVTNTGGNLREVFWPAGEPAETNSQVCATWKYQSTDKDQEGLAARFTTSGGVTRGITVTKNVIYGIWWVMNVHVWDTSVQSYPFTQIAQFDYSKLLITSGSTEVAFPWKACLRVAGATLAFKLWVPASTPTTPSWSDPTYVRTATLPDGYENAGEDGWYAGHIPAGGSMTYGNLGIWAYK